MRRRLGEDESDDEAEMRKPTSNHKQIKRCNVVQYNRNDGKSCSKVDTDYHQQHTSKIRNVNIKSKVSSKSEQLVQVYNRNKRRKIEGESVLKIGGNQKKSHEQRRNVTRTPSVCENVSEKFQEDDDDDQECCYFEEDDQLPMALNSGGKAGNTVFPKKRGCMPSSSKVNKKKKQHGTIDYETQTQNSEGGTVSAQKVIVEISSEDDEDEAKGREKQRKMAPKNGNSKKKQVEDQSYDSNNKAREQFVRDGGSCQRCNCSGCKVPGRSCYQHIVSYLFPEMEEENISKSKTGKKVWTKQCKSEQKVKEQDVAVNEVKEEEEDEDDDDDGDDADDDDDDDNDDEEEEEKMMAVERDDEEVVMEEENEEEEDEEEKMMAVERDDEEVVMEEVSEEEEDEEEVEEEVEEVEEDQETEKVVVIEEDLNNNNTEGIDCDDGVWRRQHGYRNFVTFGDKDEEVQIYYGEDKREMKNWRRQKGGKMKGRGKNAAEKSAEEEGEDDGSKEVDKSTPGGAKKGKKKGVEKFTLEKKDEGTLERPKKPCIAKEASAPAKEKKQRVDHAYDEIGIKIDSSMCHQCKRNDKGRVVRCTKCKTKRFCIPCIRNWYPRMTEEQFAQACPVCLRELQLQIMSAEGYTFQSKGYLIGGIAGNRNPRKRRETGSISRDPNPPIILTINTYGIRFQKPDHVAKFQNMASRRIKPTKFYDHRIVEEWGCREEVEQCLENLGILERSRGMRDYTYKRPTLEFLSTLECKAGEPKQRGGPPELILNFQLFNRQHELTLTQLNNIFDWPNGELGSLGREELDDIEPLEYWRQITGSDDFNSRSSKASEMVQPVLRFIHRMLVMTCFHKHETGCITGAELQLVYRSTVLEAGLRDDINLGAYFVDRCLETAKGEVFKKDIIGGGWVTIIAKALGHEGDILADPLGPVSENILLDAATLRTMHFFRGNRRNLPPYTWLVKDVPYMRVPSPHTRLTDPHFLKPPADPEVYHPDEVGSQRVAMTIDPPSFPRHNHETDSSSHPPPPPNEMA